MIKALVSQRDSFTMYCVTLKKEENSMKKVMTIILMVVLAIGVLTGCDQATRVSSNLSQEADSFNITRKLTAFNQRTGDVVFVAVGNFSLQKESDGDLTIVGEDDDGYYKHFVYLSSEIGYTCEQLKVSNVSKYKFTINYNPNYLFPVDFDYIE